MVTTMIFLPLETLPGWPEAPEVSTAFYWMLMIIGPLALGAVVALLTWVPRLSRAARQQSESTDITAV